MKCYIVYRDEFEIVKQEIDAAAGIQFTANGGIINFETADHVCSFDSKHIIEICFE